MQEKTTKSWRLQAHGADVKACAFSPDGKLLACGSEDKNIALWSFWL